MTSLIINNNDLYFGSKINTNSNTYDLLYLNNTFKVNYIKRLQMRLKVLKIMVHT